jgi:3-deoxy-D-manno-octulosonate 8-phosphate phosphatase (KDO 8-P phosphatase)
MTGGAAAEAMTDIRALVLDADGVLTDGRIYMGPDGSSARAFHVQDGLAIHWFQKLGGLVIVISGKASPALEARTRELGIEHVIQGSRDKLADLLALLEPRALSLEQLAMIGDDLVDLPILRRCGYPIAVANAVAEVKAVARYVTRRAGGHGAVREAIEHLLRATGGWEQVLEHYGAAPSAAEDPGEGIGPTWPAT